MPGVDDVSSPQQQTSIATSPILSPSDDRENFLCLGSTNKDPRQAAGASQTSRINSTGSTNAAADLSLHTPARKRRSSNGSTKLTTAPGNSSRQHSTDCLAPNYRDNGRGVASSVNSQQYPAMQYWQNKDRQQQTICHDDENRRFSSAKSIDAQPDKTNKLEYTKRRQATIQRTTANYSLRVKQFFYQILSGCRNPKCSNRLCASCSFKGNECCYIIYASLAMGH